MRVGLQSPDGAGTLIHRKSPVSDAINSKLLALRIRTLFSGVFMYWGEFYLKYINRRVDTVLITLTTIVIHGHVSTWVWRKFGGRSGSAQESNTRCLRQGHRRAQLGS